MNLAKLREIDNGFFGPGSPTWKVWTSPTALIGFQRSVVLEHFDPHLAAAVADMDGIYADLRAGSPAPSPTFSRSPLVTVKRASGSPNI